MDRYRRRISWALKRVRLAVIAQAGREEDLVGVDVPDAGHELLVHEQRLERAMAIGQQLAEVRPAHDLFERVEAQVGELGHLGGDVGRRR